MNHHVEAITADPPPWEQHSVLRQRWTELASFHWPYTPAVVQDLLAPGVTVDTFDGRAWVGLIPFEMRDVQLGPTRPLPWLGRFIEINVRTYVIDSLGRRAVWFYSLDVPRSAIVAVARSVFSLPYCWARAEHGRDGDEHWYRMTRRWPGAGATADMGFRVGRRIPDVDVSALDHFLTARWALLTARRNGLAYGRVHHRRWPLHEVHDVRVEQTVLTAAGLPAPMGAPHARYSPGVDVEVAWFDPV